MAPNRYSQWVDDEDETAKRARAGGKLSDFNDKSIYNIGLHPDDEKRLNEEFETAKGLMIEMERLTMTDTTCPCVVVRCNAKHAAKQSMSLLETDSSTTIRRAAWLPSLRGDALAQ